jgi:hypothetical protein
VLVYVYNVIFAHYGVLKDTNYADISHRSTDACVRTNSGSAVGHNSMTPAQMVQLVKNRYVAHYTINFVVAVHYSMFIFYALLTCSSM